MFQPDVDTAFRQKKPRARVRAVGLPSCARGAPRLMRARRARTRAAGGQAVAAHARLAAPAERAAHARRAGGRGRGGGAWREANPPHCGRPLFGGVQPRAVQQRHRARQDLRQSSRPHVVRARARACAQDSLEALLANIPRLHKGGGRTRGAQSGRLGTRRSRANNSSRSRRSCAHAASHFCRQKVLCSEPDCPRCSQLDKEKECIGKTQCYGAGCAARREGRAGPNDGRYKCSLFETGVFCRACLSVRYGQGEPRSRSGNLRSATR
jgi:hypothetical protein